MADNKKVVTKKTQMKPAGNTGPATKTGLTESAAKGTSTAAGAVKSVATKTASAKPATTKKKVEAKNTTKKTPASKTVASKTAATKSAAKKAPAKKAPTRKSAGTSTASPAISAANAPMGGGMKPAPLSPKPAPRPAAAKPAMVPSATSATAPISDQERREMIAKAAYYRAQQRNFAPGDEQADWLAAEAEVDAILRQQSAE